MSKKIIGIIAAIAVVVIIVMVAMVKPEMPAAEEAAIIDEEITPVVDSVATDTVNFDQDYTVE